MRSRTLATLLLAGLLPAAASCVVVEDERDEKTPVLVAWCDSSSECAADLVCDDGVHLCVSSDPAQIDGWIRLVPPAGNIVAVEEYYPAAALNDSDKLILNRPVKVVGRVLVQGDSLTGSEVADIVAVADGEIPQLKIQTYAKAAQELAVGGGVAKAGFEFLAAQGIPYDIRVYMAAEQGQQAAPPYHRLRSFKPDFDNADPYVYEMDIEVPAVEDYLHITGRVSLEVAGGEALAGAKVYATSDTTYNESSVAVTGPDGAFDILVQPPEELEGESYTIHVARSADNEVVPAIDLDPIVVAGHVTLDDIAVTGLDVLAEVSVDVVAPSGEFEPAYLSNTAVRFTGKVGAGLLQIERTVDASGRVVFLLPAGNYVLSVLPPANSVDGDVQRYGLLQKQFSVFDASPLVSSAKLALMPRVHGLVRGPDEEPVPGTRVLAIHTGKGPFPQVHLPSRQYETQSDETGRYAVHVDPGVYTLVLEPPPESGLPRKIFRDVAFEQDQQRTFELPAPSALRGTILGYVLPREEQALAAEDTGGESPAPTKDLLVQEPEKAPVADVRVELYDEDDLSDDASDPIPTPIAAAYTDKTGAFVLLVPAE